MSVGDGREGYFSENYVVLADGPIKTIDRHQGQAHRHQRHRLGERRGDADHVPHNGIKDTDFTTVETNFAEHAGDARRR